MDIQLTKFNHMAVTGQNRIALNLTDPIPHKSLKSASRAFLGNRYLVLGLGRKGLAMNKNIERYEQEKAQWIASHPEATPSEYQVALRQIANRCGV